MARRKESGLDLVASLPWPVGIALGLIAFALIRYGIGAYLSQAGGPFGAAVGGQLSGGMLAPFAWLALLGCWLAAGASFVRGRRRRHLLETRASLESIAALSWRDFEALVGEAFRRAGYQVEETPQDGADGGIDLILRKDGRASLVQCKRWRRKQVPVNTVREMWGLRAHHGADAVKIVCVGSYTPDARKFAEGKAIELITGEELIHFVHAVQNPGLPSQPGGTTGPEQQKPPASTFETSPACPACAAGMVLRTNRRTREQFWGCQSFPRCRGTRTL